MAFSCAGARHHGGVAVAKCRPAAALLGRRGGCFLPAARRLGAARGIRADLPPPRANADGGASPVTAGPAVAVPKPGDATTEQQVSAVPQPVAAPETHGKVGGADVDDGAGGNGKFPPGGGGGDGENGGGGGGGGDSEEGEDEFGPILSFEQVVQEAEKRGVSLPSLPADMVEAAKSVGIQKLLLLRYLDMQVRGLLIVDKVIRLGFS